MRLKFYEQVEDRRDYITKIDCDYVPILGQRVFLRDLDDDIKNFICQSVEPVYNLIEDKLESIIVVLYDDSNDSDL